jgi:hypothetical protein
MASVPVNVDNFARAETALSISRLLAQSGGVNTWFHHRAPAPLDDQPIIRLNRDTLYSYAIADISGGARLVVPDPGERYLSVMVVNEDHYINAVIHEPGEHALDVATFETPYVIVGVRTLVDPNDPEDVARVGALQDRLSLTAASATPYKAPEYDTDSQDRTRSALLELARGVSGFDRSFGRRDQVDPVRHLLGTAAGFGGLPESEAYYLNVEPHLPVGAYRLTVPADTPVDGFWSISLYDADGYFPTGTDGAVNLNSVTAARNADGSVTVHFGGALDLPNRLALVPDWNYLVRFYRPRTEILDGTWTLPAPERAD